jgi:hypothetical protein
MGACALHPLEPPPLCRTLSPASGAAGAGEWAGAVGRLGQGTVVLPRVSGLGRFCTPDMVCLSGMSGTLPLAAMAHESF